MSLVNVHSWTNAPRLLEILTLLSCRTGDLEGYLETIASGVSELLTVDWSVVTLSEGGTEMVMASSLDIGEHRVFSTHGRMARHVLTTGMTLMVEDALHHPEYGRIPAGYRAYLGVPLRTPQNQVIGTICSFHRTPRQFSTEELRIVELFSERAAIALDNFLLYRQERHFHERLEVEVRQHAEELRAAQARLVERERLAAVGEFAACIVHEIRNPLTTINCVLDHLHRLDLPAATRERLQLARDDGERLERLLSEILLYARPQMLCLQEVDLAELVAGVIQRFAAQGQQTCFLRPPEPILVVIDPDKFIQVLVNLGQNACQAVGPTGLITWCIEPQPSGALTVSVHNGGPPIPSTILPRLTEPFFSTRPSGTGLGLAIVRRIVDAHGGCLEITSTAEDGTRVAVHLPAH